MERRSTSRSVATWLLTATASLAAAIATTLAITWYIDGRDSITPPNEGPFVAAAAPAPATTAEFATTVDLATTAPPTTLPIRSTTTTTAAAATGDVESSLLGGHQLPPVERGAAVPSDRPPRVRPTGMQISSIDVSRYPVREIGLDVDGALEIPDATEIGWYRYGATAGSPGSTVMAAHVSWNGQIGPFFELGALDPGAQVEVQLDDGNTRWYEVVERATYAKDELPRERIWRNTGPETLVLITCGGDFNPEIRSYRHNVVVYAVPAG